MKHESNYEVFKQDALKRFLTYNQELIIQRLGLKADDAYIYIEYCKCIYRLGRKMPSLERNNLIIMNENNDYSAPDSWKETDYNEALTLCDLLCHTDEPIHLSENYVPLQSLNTVQGGSTQSTLGKGLLKSTEQFFDGKDKILRSACESLGGIATGKGDVAYEIPLFESIHARFSFYDSDEEFEAKATIMFPSDICNYLYFETLWYASVIMLDRLKELISANEGNK
jgi:hypothetical protein